jgi:O-succinylbenzoic acid--CoA ligase
VSRPVRVVPASPARLPGLLSALRAALDGSGPAVLPFEDGTAPLDPGPPVADDVALLVRTSGSTGEPREVLLTADALAASGRATADRLRGHGSWLLALPSWHVAGLQVIARSVLAGTEPVVLDGPTRPGTFAAACAGLLADPTAAAALTTFDAVLLGGAAAAPTLVAVARAAGVPVVTTYGMSETCGGCVYDGVPLDGVQVTIDADDRISIAGPVLAAGYRGAGGSSAFEEHGGRRSVRTSDLGRWSTGADGVRRLQVLGRADDVLVTGGEKIAPAAVEAVLAGLPDVVEVCVVGVPDLEWGQVLVAVIVPRPGTTPDVEALRRPVADALGRAAAPRHVLIVDALPLRGPGKTDRRAVTDLAARALGRTATAG